MIGIVPAHHHRLEYKMPWPDSLIQIERGFTAIERAAYECAYAGCDQIWVIAKYGEIPLLKRRIGQAIVDPVGNYKPYWVNRRRYITVVYASLNPVDIGRRDCLSYAAIWGAEIAARVMGTFSRKIKPDKFYVAWPYGVYDYFELIEIRKKILDSEKPFFVEHNNRTVMDGDYLGFAAFPEHFNIARYEFRNKATGRYESVTSEEIRKAKEEGIPTPQVLLPKEKQFSGRNFTVGDTFGVLKDEVIDFNSHEVSWYDPIETWDDYRTYMGNKRELYKPYPREIYRYRNFYPPQIRIFREDEDE